MKVRKPIAILLSLIMIFSVFTIIPVTTAGATGESNESGSGQSGSGQSGSSEIGVEGTEPEVAQLTAHPISLYGIVHGYLTSDKSVAYMGQKVTLFLIIEPGYRLISWNQSPADLVIKDNSFIMPDCDVSIYPQIEAIPSHNVTVTTNGHGTASADVEQAQEGTAVTLTATPDAGYILQGWQIISGGVTIENNSFVMLTKDVEVKAVFAYGRFVSDLTELKTALNDGSGVPVFLKNDIQVEGLASVFSGKTGVLDLNGCTLSRNGDTVLGAYGDLTLRDTKGGGKVTGGTSSGINVESGSLTIEGGEISGNSSGKGGGIYVKNGTLIMKGGSVRDNSSTLYGGGIYLTNSTMTMSGGTVGANSASSRGGGIYLADASHVTITGGSVAENTAATGGGVCVSKSCTMTFSGGEISENAADTAGGGVYLAEFASFTMEGGSVTDNTAPQAPAVAADGAFSLSGGSITGNIGTDSSNHGAIRVVTNNASIELSGDPIVKDNLVNNQQSNVFLVSAKNLSITGELADTARIGVMKETDGVFTSGLNGRGTLANLISDNAGKAIFLNDAGEAYFVTKVNPVTVSVNYNNMGTASASAESAEAGTVVTLTAAPNQRYRLKDWVVISGGVTIEDDQFVMPYEPVEIRAIFEEIIYPITVTVEDPAFGTATASRTSAPEGIFVSLNATPTEGYRFKEWLVVSNNVTITDNQFLMPDAAVEIKAVFEKVPHSVSIIAHIGGSAHADKDMAIPGDIVTVTVTPDENYRFSDYWCPVAFEPTDIPGVYEFQMPEYDVNITVSFEPLFAIHTDGNVNTFRWVSWNTETITTAGEGDEVYIALNENAVPDEGKYFTGEYAVDGVSLGCDDRSVYIDHFDMPDHAVTVSAIQADKEKLTIDLRSGEAVELSDEVYIKLITDDRIVKTYVDETEEILLDLDSSGTPDVRLYFIEVKDGNDVVTDLTCYAVLLPDADATGRSSIAYSGNTEHYTTIAFLLPGGTLCGDADGDDFVTILDATVIQRKLANFEVGDYNATAADADGDGTVTILDATAIQRKLAGFDDGHPIGEPI